MVGQPCSLPESDPEFGVVILPKVGVPLLTELAANPAQHGWPEPPCPASHPPRVNSVSQLEAPKTPPPKRQPQGCLQAQTVELQTKTWHVATSIDTLALGSDWCHPTSPISWARCRGKKKKAHTALSFMASGFVCRPAPVQSAALPSSLVLPGGKRWAWEGGWGRWPGLCTLE